MGLASKKTSSICTSEMEVGTHVFTIAGYSLKIGRGVGEIVRSTAFAVGGHDWAIRFYPDGATKDQEGLVAIAVELVSKNAEAWAFFDLGVVHPDLGKQSLGSGDVPSKPILFKGSAGRFKVKVVELPRHDLEKSGFIQNDRLVIECVLTVIKESQVYETTRCSEVEVPPSDITEHLHELFKAEVGVDVTFTVGVETFKAHKILLAARSTVFKAEFYGLMREASEPDVTIYGMQPQVFGALLHFIYTDSLPDLSYLEGDEHYEMIEHLLEAADRYAVARLKLVCENILGNRLAVPTVLTTLALADQHHCSKLKDVCIDFAADKMDDVMKTDGYENFKRICSYLAVNVLEKRIRLCEDWMSSSSEAKSSH